MEGATEPGGGDPVISSQFWHSLCDPGHIASSLRALIMPFANWGVVLITRVPFSSVKHHVRPLGMLSRTEFLVGNSDTWFGIVSYWHPSTWTVLLLDGGICPHPCGFNARASMFKIICWNGWSLGFAHTPRQESYPTGCWFILFDKSRWPLRST